MVLQENKAYTASSEKVSVARELALSILKENKFALLWGEAPGS